MKLGLAIRALHLLYAEASITTSSSPRAPGPRAFSECLRQELRGLPDVDVATMLPQAVDRPIFGNAANYSGRAVRPVPPMVDPTEVAEGIVKCARDPKREVTYRRTGRVLELLHSFAPALYQRLLPAAFEAGNFAAIAAPGSPGSVLEPRLHGVHGGWKQRRRELAAAFVDGLAAGTRALFGRPNRESPRGS